MMPRRPGIEGHRSWGETTDATAQGYTSGTAVPTSRSQMSDPQPNRHDERPERLMVIVAHPDDADFGPAATIAGWIARRDGGASRLLHQRRRRRGRRAHGPLELAALREKEQRAAAAHVGYAEVTFLHRPDGALANDLALREQLVRVIRQFKPDAVVHVRPHDPHPRRRLHPAHRPPRGRHGRRRRGLPGRPQRDGVPQPRHPRGPGAAHGQPALPLLDRQGERLGGRQRHDRHQDRRAARARQPAAPARRSSRSASGPGPRRRAPPTASRPRSPSGSSTSADGSGPSRRSARRSGRDGHVRRACPDQQQRSYAPPLVPQLAQAGRARPQRADHLDERQVGRRPPQMVVDGDLDAARQVAQRGRRRDPAQRRARRTPRTPAPTRDRSRWEPAPRTSRRRGPAGSPGRAARG